MNLLVAVQHHGYAATAVILLLSACGVPLPISVVLLTAGAAAHSGSLNLGLVILCAAGAALTGDTILYFGGRFTGWWLLGRLCRFSLNPEKCIFGSARSFYRRGPRTLAGASCAAHNADPAAKEFPRITAGPALSRRSRAIASPPTACAE